MYFAVVILRGCGEFFLLKSYKLPPPSRKCILALPVHCLVHLTTSWESAILSLVLVHLSWRWATKKISNPANMDRWNLTHTRTPYTSHAHSHMCTHTHTTLHTHTQLTHTRAHTHKHPTHMHPVLIIRTASQISVCPLLSSGNKGKWDYVSILLASDGHTYLVLTDEFERKWHVGLLCQSVHWWCEVLLSFFLSSATAVSAHPSRWCQLHQPGSWKEAMQGRAPEMREKLLSLQPLTCLV